MKKFYIFTLCMMINHLCQALVVDPIVDYLNQAENNVWGRADRHYYSSDVLYRYDVDLNKDGKKEVLISSTLDRDGKQGNVFYLYKTINRGYEFVRPLERKEGSSVFTTLLTLNPNGFYLGKIDEIGQYGIVKFGPGGAGEGTYQAYVFNGKELHEFLLGRLEYDYKAKQWDAKGLELSAKYMKTLSDSVRESINRFRKERRIEPYPSDFVGAATIISAEELAKRYGIRIDPRTYQQAFEEEMAKESRTNAAPIPSSK
ncbi:MAG: hypothetical protein K1X66_01830 [Verrucomicrobiae bacterium]|nr:hypothetical protein [Verrucomicrobiae bacterium]